MPLPNYVSEPGAASSMILALKFGGSVFLIAADLRELLALRIQGASGAPARGRAHASRRGLQEKAGSMEKDLLDH